MITINGKTLTLSAPMTLGAYLDENNYRRTYISQWKKTEKSCPKANTTPHILMTAIRSKLSVL